MNLNYCIDLDNTLVNLNDIWIRKVSKELGYNYVGSDNDDWTLKWLPDDFQKRSHELFHDPEFMGNLPVIEGSQAKLLEWKCKNNKLTIVTAREQIISSATHKLVRREFPMVDDIMVVGWNNDKEEVLKDFDVVIDDNPLCIRAAVKVEVPYIFMVSNDNTRYNLPYYEEFEGKVNIVESILGVNI